MRCRREIAVVIALLGASAASGEELAVDAINASISTLCAENDNVYVKFVSGDVRRFSVEATHPAYLRRRLGDRTAADFRHCDSSKDPVHRFIPRRVVLYESAQLKLVGFAFAQFWRANEVPVRVGDRSETGLHLLQLWARIGKRPEEVLVLYPSDGYWRARPLAPPHLPASAYGSSFLVGPVEEQGRPFVNIQEITFDPAARAFRMGFARSGTAELRLVRLDHRRITLEISLDPVSSFPFAALRSMYVNRTNADVAQVSWRAAGEKVWHATPILRFERAQLAEFWAGRNVPSRHNTSAPDMTFRAFR